jgi:hypothetical protein
MKPLREYGFNLKAYADGLLRSDPFGDVTKLPIGHAHIRYGPEREEAAWSTSFQVGR